jgi:vacuolar-type H+-ATPase subunit I/STV1
MKIIITESQYRKLVENVEIIDVILDKMGEIGYENLENEDKMTLKRYSEWLNSGKKGDFMGEITPKNDDFDVKSGEEFSTYLRDGSEFSFRYDYEDILEDENIFYGSVRWHGEEWIGLIATDKDGELKEIDFVLDQDTFQSYDLDDETAGYDEENEKRLQDEVGEDIHQVKYFFQEEVIPNLIS